MPIYYHLPSQEVTIDIDKRTFLKTMITLLAGIGAGMGAVDSLVNDYRKNGKISRRDFLETLGLAAITTGAAHVASPYLVDHVLLPAERVDKSEMGAAPKDEIIEVRFLRDVDGLIIADYDGHIFKLSEEQSISYDAYELVHRTNQKYNGDYASADLSLKALELFGVLEQNSNVLNSLVENEISKFRFKRNPLLIINTTRSYKIPVPTLYGPSLEEIAVLSNMKLVPSMVGGS